MNKGVIYYTRIREEYQNTHLEHMIGDKLLETALKQERNIKLSEEPRGVGEHGKPFLSYRPGVHYNISHSGAYVVCALADQEVGIDIQIHRTVNYDRTLRRMVTEKEREEILKRPDLEQEFFRQWVMREAFIKWTGEGLSRDLRKISVKEGVCRFLNLPEKEKGYSCALWSADPMEITWKYADIILG